MVFLLEIALLIIDENELDMFFFEKLALPKSGSSPIILDGLYTLEKNSTLDPMFEPQSIINFGKFFSFSKIFLFLSKYQLIL